MDSWLTELINFLYNENLSIINSPSLLFTTLSKIQQKQQIITEIKKLNQKIDETWFVKAKAGVSHLCAGLNTDIDKIKNSEFEMARVHFNTLSNLSPVEEIYHNLIVVGHWGNYNYFNLLGDYRNAAIQVYQCTLDYPVLALATFPLNFYDNFTTDLPQEMSKLLTEIKDLDKNTKKIDSELQKKMALYLGIGGIGILAIGIVAPILIPILGGAGIQALGALSQHGSNGLRRRMRDDLTPLEKESKSKNTELKIKIKTVQKECIKRINILQKISLK